MWEKRGTGEEVVRPSHMALISPRQTRFLDTPTHGSPGAEPRVTARAEGSRAEKRSPSPQSSRVSSSPSPLPFHVC